MHGSSLTSRGGGGGGFSLKFFFGLNDEIEGNIL